MKMTQRRYGIEIECFTKVNIQTVIAEIVARGVEIAYAGYTHQVTSGWKVVTDGSLITSQAWHDGTTGITPYKGYEIVSPILKGQAGLDQLRIVCDVLAQFKFKVNKTSGLHIHHEIKNETTQDIKRVIAFYAHHESAIDSFMAWSRRDDHNGFCHTVRIPDTFGELANATTINQVSLALQTRYRKLNLFSYVKYGTMEFRHHQGTVEFEKIARWIQFGQALLCAAPLKGFVPTADPWDIAGMFNTIGQFAKLEAEMITYFVRRADELANTEFEFRG